MLAQRVATSKLGKQWTGQPMKQLLLAILLPVQFAVAAGASPVAVPDNLAERVKPCVACHGPKGRAGGDAYYPRLAGKPQGYLLLHP